MFEKYVGFRIANYCEDYHTIKHHFLEQKLFPFIFGQLDNISSIC